MSFYGPNAIIDDDKTRVYDYNQDRNELDKSNLPHPAGSANVPVQQMSDLWKQQQGQMPPPPNMWMPPMMPGANSANSSTGAPLNTFPMGMMPPNMPPLPQGQMMPNMPPMPHPMQGMPGPWAPPFGFQNPWFQQQPGQQPQMPQMQQQQQQQQQVPQVPQQQQVSQQQQAPQVQQAPQAPPTPAQSTQPDQKQTKKSSPAPANSSSESKPTPAAPVPKAPLSDEPYSLTPKHNVTASSIREARENPRQGGIFSKRAPPSTSNTTPGFYTEEYMHESELIRPNRRFRHLMSDHDKRAVMEKCVKSIAQDDPVVDDYYYHIFARVHGNIGSSKTTLHRYRRVFNRGGEGSTADKMRQQVQRAVDRAQEHRAKQQDPTTGAKPTRKTVAGSRPRQAVPALSEALGSSAGSQLPASESTREATLRNIELAYEQLFKLEAHAQRRPDPSSPEAAEWAAEGPPLQEELWQSFQVQRPVDKQGKQPFIEMLLVPKGMKAFARSWPHFDPTRRLTVLTRLVVSIDGLKINLKHFELFGQVVVQPIVHLIGEADFETILLMADLAQSKASQLAQSKVGQLLVTAIISRGEMLASSNGDDDMETQWSQAFAPIFDEIVPVLDKLDVRDDQVWHFFAALALGSDLERQSELVEHVRKQIFSQQALAKKLGGEAGDRKIQALNLFLNVLGLNATLEDIEALKA